ncbi:hypothetical protein Hypma_002119 [Hypsizygus marmoreus]|uniref:Uncharacterized protein n=1 Tax=Hypsizygus marmoreus TaxID=39966 RepID=A0A369K7M5_HYPMA|nr:hypothetical protein Hypma_002119 [Hypsizygus marmoreus]
MCQHHERELAHASNVVEPEHATYSLDSHLSLAEGQPRHEVQLPEGYRDILPQPAAALPPDIDIPVPVIPNGTPGSPLRPGVQKLLRSPLNIFRLFRQYHGTNFPSHDPEQELSTEELSDISKEQPSSAGSESYGPYPNQSSFSLGAWYWNTGVQKSKENFKELVDIVSNPAFKPEDVRHTVWDKIDKHLGGTGDDDDLWVDEFDDAGWTKEPIEIVVPFHRLTPTPGPRAFTAGHFHRRSILAIIRERLAKEDSAHFHFEPYELYWQPTDDGPPMRVYGELYTSPAFIDVHNQLQNSPPEPGCNLPRVVVGLMFASDKTHLTSFGDTHLWPVYLCFGNDSKYRRSRPSCHLFNHLAYFQTLPDDFDDFYISHTAGKRGPDDKVTAFCRRESTHAQWRTILDDEFIEAYKHGIVITCIDGLQRRFYPRVFVYSADYQEK